MTNTTQEPDCLTCALWRPKESGDMLKHGFARCTRNGQVARFTAPSNHCPQFRKATADVIAGRVVWLEKLNNRGIK